MITATIPTGTREQQYRDLEQRATTAMTIAEQALAAGDEAKLRKAVARYYLRLAQMTRLQQMPEGARCPGCVYGMDEPWAKDFWSEPDPWALCLEHGVVPDGWTVEARMRNFDGVPS